MDTRLYILLNGVYNEIDLFDDIAIPISYQVADIQDISKKNSNFSKEFDIPCTERNMRVIGNLSVASSGGNLSLSKKYKCYITKNGKVVLNGIVVVNKVNYNIFKPTSYTINVYSEVINFIDKLQNKTIGDLFWNEDGTRDTSFDLSANSLSPANWRNTYSAPTFARGVGYACVDKYNSYNEPLDYWRSKDVTPFIYASRIFDKIIQKNGYKWKSFWFKHAFDGSQWDDQEDFPWVIPDHPYERIAETAEFDPWKLVIPSIKTNEAQRWILPGVGSLMPITQSLNPLTDTYVNRTDNDDSEIKYDIKSNVSADTTAPGQAILIDQSDHLFISTVFNYEVKELDQNEALVDTDPAANYYFTAQVPGWYKVACKFDWRYSVRAFQNSDGTGEVGDDKKIRIIDGDTTAYDISFNILVYSQGNITYNRNMYYNSASAAALGWKNSGNSKKIILDDDFDSGSGIVVAESTEYDEHNSDNDSAVKNIGANGWTWNKPVDYSTLVYMHAGDHLYITSQTRFYNTYLYDDDNEDVDTRRPLYKRLGNYKYSRGSTLRISCKHDEKLLDIQLVDKVGPYRALYPEMILDPNMKQIDFFNAFVKQFNLYIEDISYKQNPFYLLPTGEEENTLRIEPREVFYNLNEDANWNPKTWNFTQYVNASTISFNRPNEYLYKLLKFNNEKDDNDYMANLFSDDFNTFNKWPIYNQSDSEMEINVAFGASRMGIVASQPGVMRGSMMPLIYSFEDEDKLNENYTSTLRLLQLSSQNNSNSIKVYTDSTTYVMNPMPILSNFNAAAASNVTSDLNFNFKRMANTKLIDMNLYTLRESNNAYHAFYEQEYKELTDEGARILTCECYIPEDIINRLKLSDTIIIDNVKYHINKIADWTSSYTPCNCEFLKIL